MNAKISQAILSQVATGSTIAEAMEVVLGKGAYEKMVSDVYDELVSIEVESMVSA